MNRHLIVKIGSARRPGDGRASAVGAAVLAAALLAGCGQKGPLWVPGHSKNTPWPMRPVATDASATVPVPGQGGGPATQATPVTPATPATPAAAATPGIPATTATPTVPATPPPQGAQ